MKVLVTGANGMLAANIIEELLNSGYLVRGTIRNRNKYKGTLHPNLELIECDFTDFDTMLEVVNGCDSIIHAAAITAQNHINYEEYRRVNVEATERLLKIAMICKIKRFVFVSSANTIGRGSESVPGDEKTPLRRPLIGSMYARSKSEAERVILGYSRIMDVIVVNPTFMIGRYGSLNGSNRILRMAKATTFCPPGGKSFIDVEDAARGILLALEWGLSGERYLISGDNLSFKSFFQIFPHVKRIIVVPRCVMVAIGLFGNMLRSVGIKTSLSITNIRILCTECFYSNNKAKSELGFSCKPISEFINSKK